MNKFLLLIFFTCNVFAQETDNIKLTSFFKELKSFNYEKSKLLTTSFTNDSLKRKTRLLVDVLSNPERNFAFNCKSTKHQSINADAIIDHLICGYLLLHNDPQSNDAYKHFQNALEFSEKVKNDEGVKFSLISVLLFYNKQVLQTNDEQQKVLTKYKSLISDKEDEFYLYLYNLYFNLRRIDLNFKMDENFINDFYSLMNAFDKEHDFWAIFYSIMGVYKKDDVKKATRYLKNSIRLSNGKKHLNYLMLRGYLHLSHLSKEQKLYDDAYRLLLKAGNYVSTKDSLKLNYFLNSYKADVFSKKEDYKKAYDYLVVSMKQKEELDYLKNNIEISNLNVKYETEKKEKQILVEKQKRKQNAYLFYGALGFLVFGAIIASLFLNNSRKKRQLAEQEKKLEQQKNITLLKEQELNAINAMVEGQEKERKRIAEDLHDNVGSVLATLKLHFENLKLNREKEQFNQGELYERTENLIDETYAKIRHIAHEKNAGVIANQGLLVAVKAMAEKISTANKTAIEVVDFGLNKRLDNALEISVFRIIQELTTNVLKHAEAKNATINISQYDDELNIIIEDDGKGFDIKKVNLNNGMGLNSIKTRVEHLNGTFEIDSSIGKGTSVIINLPIT